jgi:lipid A 3-O-deacylase
MKIMLKLKLLLMIFTISLNADQFSFLFYNDYFAGTDKHFTNGVSLSWLDRSYKNTDINASDTTKSFTSILISKLPSNLIDTSKKYNAGLSVNQIIFTPVKTTLSTPQYNDMPYVGYLNLSFYLFEWNETSFREYRMELGVVGEESGAEFFQNTFHALIKNPKLQGWDTQLGTKYTANALFRYGENSWQGKTQSGLNMDWFNHCGFEAGNFLTNAFTGTMFRVGENYIQNFNTHYPYLKEEASLLRLTTKHRGYGWSFSAGINGELLAYSYILDEAKKEGYAVESYLVNASLYAGTDLYYNSSKFTFFYQLQSPYNVRYNKESITGGFMYAYEF